MSSRLEDAILQNDRAMARGHEAPMLDPTYGGMMGWSPDMGQWVSKTGYVRRNIIPILLEAPRGFQYLPNPEYFVRMLRNIVETHPISIEGFQSTLTVNTDVTPFGGAGEQFQDITNVVRARTEPVFVLPDLYGASVNRFLEYWITYLMMDPEAKTALVNTLGTTIPPDMLADMYAMTMLFIEPDPQSHSVVRAWLSTNMYPLSGGEVVGKRDIANDMDLVRYNIPFAATTQTGMGVKVLAKRILDAVRFAGANPYHRNSHITQIAADVLNAPGGWINGVNDLANNSVRV